jgi:hypothetical protein
MSYSRTAGNTAPSASGLNKLNGTVTGTKNWWVQPGAGFRLLATSPPSPEALAPLRWTPGLPSLAGGTSRHIKQCGYLSHAHGQLYLGGRHRTPAGSEGHRRNRHHRRSSGLGMRSFTLGKTHSRFIPSRSTNFFREWRPCLRDWFAGLVCRTGLRDWFAGLVDGSHAISPRRLRAWAAAAIESPECVFRLWQTSGTWSCARISHRADFSLQRWHRSIGLWI